MPRFQFEDGAIVEFEKEPTADDLRKAYAAMFPQAKPSPAPAPQKSIWQKAADLVSSGVMQEAEANKAAGENIYEQTKGGIAQAKAGAQAVRHGKNWDERAGGLSDVVRGAGTAVAPLLAPVAGAALTAGGLPAIASLGAGLIAQPLAEKGLESAGVPPGMSRLGGDVVGAFGFTKAGAKIAAAAKPKVVPKPKTPGPNIFRPQTKSVEKEVLQSAAVPAKTAQESASAWKDPSPPVFKSAKESAEVFETRTHDPKPLNRQQRRESIIPKDDSVPEDVLRVQDRREQVAKELTGKPWSQLENSERITVDELITPPPKGPFKKPVSPRRREQQRGSVVVRGTRKVGPEDEFLNFGRISVSEAEENALRSEIQKMMKSGQLSKEVEPHEEVLRHAATIGPEALKNVMANRGEGIAGRAGMLAMRQRQNGIVREIVAARKSLANPSKPIDEATRSALENKIAEQEGNLQQYLKWTAGQRTEAGRNLSALRIMANATTDIDFWASKAKSAMGLPSHVDLPKNVLDDLTSLIAEAEKDSAKRGLLAKKISDLQKTGPLETITTLWKAGLLTSPVTHVTNVAGNAAFQAMEGLSRIPASLIDMAISPVSGKRQVLMPTPQEGIRAGIEAATNGVRQAAAILRSGATPDQLLKGNIPRELNFQGLKTLAEKQPEGLLRKVLGTSNDVINAYGRLPFRMLSAEDRIFKSFAIKSSLDQQAKLIAINEAKAGKIAADAVQARTAELMAKPTEEMSANAVLYGDYATFNTQSPMASFVSRGATALGPVGKAALEMTLPFRNTPFEIFARLIDYTPVGAAYRISRPAIEKQFNKALKPNMQKIFSEAVGRGAVGTALMYVGYRLAMEGRATGSKPNKNEGLRNVELRAGRMPGSVQVGPDWLKVMQFAPGGGLVAMGASIAERSTKSIKDEAKRPWEYVALAGQTVMEYPMLEGIKQTMDVFTDTTEGRANRFAADKAGSFVPAIVSRVGANLVNPRVPDPQPPSDSGPLDALAYGVKARLPFVKDTLPARTDILGQPVEARRSNAVNPFRPTTAREKVDALDERLVKDRIGIGSIDRIAPEPEDEFKKRLENNPDAVRRDAESDAEYRARKIATGQVIEKQLRFMLNDLPSDLKERQKELKAAIRDVKSAFSNLAKDPSYLRLSPADRAAWLNKIATEFTAQ